MTKKQADTEARKRWGAEAYMRHTRKALTAAEKAPLLTRLKELHLNRTPENKDERQRLSGLLCAHRCDVGRVIDLGGFAMFSVSGSGDTWEEAFAKADRR